MIPYQKEKLENAVCFFAKEHHKKTRHNLYQTFLYKYLALFDFGYLKEYGKPSLGLTYRAMQKGPVPLELYDHRNDPAFFKAFSFRDEGENHKVVVSNTNPNRDYFSKREIVLMNRLVEIFAQSYVTSKIMSDVSHEEILAWKRTWGRKQNDLIDFSLEFPDDVFNKKESSLTFSEEVFLTEKGIEHCI